MAGFEKGTARKDFGRRISGRPGNANVRGEKSFAFSLVARAKRMIGTYVENPIIGAPDRQLDHGPTSPAKGRVGAPCDLATTSGAFVYLPALRALPRGRCRVRSGRRLANNPAAPCRAIKLDLSPLFPDGACCQSSDTAITAEEVPHQMNRQEGAKLGRRQK